MQLSPKTILLFPFKRIWVVFVLLSSWRPCQGWSWPWLPSSFSFLSSLFSHNVLYQQSQLLLSVTVVVLSPPNVSRALVLKSKCCVRRRPNRLQSHDGYLLPDRGPLTQPPTVNAPYPKQVSGSELAGHKPKSILKKNSSYSSSCGNINGESDSLSSTSSHNYSYSDAVYLQQQKQVGTWQTSTSSRR